MKRFGVFAVLLLIVCAPAQAALWSMSNVSLQRGTSTTISLTLTGDEVVVASDIGINIPNSRSGFHFSVASRNGGSCAIANVDGRLAIRALVVSNSLDPFPAYPVEYCEITITSYYAYHWSRGGRLFSEESSPYCAARSGVPAPCDLDPAT